MLMSILILAAIVVALLAALERERQLNVKHRAQTYVLLGRIRGIDLGLEANARARWNG